jgi:hypothetical protein
MKLIASDMDGTLLNKDHEISEENLKALRFAQSRGVELAIATGRIYYNVDDYLKKAGLKAAIIGTNGATVHTKEGEKIYEAPLDKETLIPLVAELERHQIYFTVFTENGKYRHEQGANWLESDYERMKKHESAKVQAIMSWMTPKRLMTDIARHFHHYQEILELKETIYKVVAFSFDPEKLENARAALGDDERFHIVSSGKGNFEIMDCKATKGKGLETLAKHLQIPLQETVAIGDNYNDASMFQVAGIGVAMGNAEPPVKAMADYVTATNEENGVALAINRLLSEHL